MIPADYFDRPDVPAKNSPVGKLLRKMHAEFPELELETSRIEAREALLGMGGATRIQKAYQRWLKGRSIASATTQARFSSAEKGEPRESFTAPIPALKTPANAISMSPAGFEEGAFE
jgi:hypothetical protein